MRESRPNCLLLKSLFYLLEQLQNDLETQKIKLTKHMVFQKYMDRVLEKADEFSENKDAIAR